MKTCTKCGIEKSVEKFYKRSDSKDGLRNDCKSCNSIRTREWYATNRERHAETMHRYYLNNRKRELERAQNRFNQKREEINATRREQYRKHPEKRLAHKRVYEAKKSGSLISESCVDCGSNRTIHAHHEDYMKPLDVIWLCTYCHGTRHRLANKLQ